MAVTKFAFAFDNMRTSNVFSTFDIQRMFYRTLCQMRIYGKILVLRLMRVISYDTRGRLENACICQVNFCSFYIGLGREMGLERDGLVQGEWLAGRMVWGYRRMAPLPGKRYCVYIYICLVIVAITTQRYNLASRRGLTACCCDEAKRSETVLHFCTFLLNPHFNLEPDYVIRKPIKRSFQRLPVRKYSQLFSNFTIRPPIQTNGTECAQTHTHITIPPVSLRSLSGYNKANS